MFPNLRAKVLKIKRITKIKSIKVTFCHVFDQIFRYICKVPKEILQLRYFAIENQLDFKISHKDSLYRLFRRHEQVIQIIPIGVWRLSEQLIKTIRIYDRDYLDQYKLTLILKVLYLDTKGCLVLG